MQLEAALGSPGSIDSASRRRGHLTGPRRAPSSGVDKRTVAAKSTYAGRKHVHLSSTASLGLDGSDHGFAHCLVDETGA